MATQQFALNTAREFVQAILAKGFPLKKAFLFGSFSRNEQRTGSDIDLALVADEFMGVGYFYLQYFVDIKISDKRFTSIEPHTFSTAHFEQGDPFIEQIKQAGISLM